jgi:hypothetical protein
LCLELASATATAAGTTRRSRRGDILFQDIDSSNVNRLYDETFIFLTIILFDHCFHLLSY